MKLLIITSLFVLGSFWHKCNAQSAIGGKKQGGICSPVTIFLKSRTIFEKGPWALCADLALNKNSIPYAVLGGNLLKQYHGSTPVYGSYDLNRICSLEGGAYLGITAMRAEALGEHPLPRNINPNYDLGFDSGLVTGLSFNLENFGKLRLRYNYGFTRLVNIENKNLKTRRLDVGIYFRF